jgi:hypothetical protein
MLPPVRIHVYPYSGAARAEAGPQLAETQPQPGHDPSPALKRKPVSSDLAAAHKKLAALGLELIS